MIRALIAAMFASVTVLAQSPYQPFKSGTDAAMFIVAVTDGNRVITDLTPSDFEVIDNGVKQTVSSVDFNRLPTDLRLVFDLSDSISDEELERYQRTMQQVASELDKADRCEIITFTSKLAEAAARQHPPVSIKVARGGADGTAFFDAALAALVTVPDPDRRQMTILLSDALDNTSFFDEATVFEAARRTDAVLYTVLPGDPLKGRAVSERRLDYLATLTGGLLIKKPANYIASAITDAIKEFRQSYVLRYSITDVKVPGWHKVSIKVKHGGYKVRTKPGYFGA
jgi:VWFA-related protein